MGTTQTQPTDQTQDLTQQLKLNMCQSQLQAVTASYDQNMKIIQSQISSANEQVKFTQDRLNKMQQDGGQTMKQIQDVTTQIASYKANISTKESQLIYVQGQVRELELQCDQLEKELQDQKNTYEQCMNNQGAFTTNQEIMAAISNVLVSSITTALLTKQLLK